jgi:pimeloyl-ACP methyl ester carboxylesterase
MFENSASSIHTETLGKFTPKDGCPRRWIWLRRWLAAVLLLVLGACTATWLRPMWMINQVIALQLRSQGVHSEFVNVGGHRLHYLVAGKGEPVLLIHGLGSKAEDWATLIPVLAKGGYKVYALDLLGYGKSDQPADASYSIAQQASVVRGFLDAKGLQRVNLGGWSMGGWISLKVASDAPERVERLMLFDSAGIRFDIDFDPEIFWADTPAKLDDLNTWLLPKPPHIPGFLARDMVRTFRDRQWVIRRSVRAMETGNDLMDGKLGALKMPVLIVWGSQDRLIPVTSAVVMHQEIPQSVLAVFDGCGHLAAGQCADRVGPRVLEFLHAQPPVAAIIRYIPAAQGGR